MRHELSSLFPNDISILSVDNMEKIKVGAPAVSRYHQVKCLFLEKKKNCKKVREVKFHKSTTVKCDSMNKEISLLRICKTLCESVTNVSCRYRTQPACCGFSKAFIRLPVLSLNLRASSSTF